jgi:diguanylate cyclase (GGDEF)-like protein
MILNKILIVEDNEFFAEVMRRAIVARFSSDVIIATSAEEARSILTERDFDLLVVDLILPDDEGSLIKEVCEDYDVIVTTEFEDELTRKSITSLRIIDYIIKSDSSDFSYLLNVIHRLNTNKVTTVLVVEDSVSVRNHIESLLRLQHLNVVCVNDGVEAVKFLKKHRLDIDLVITDYNMPNMDGLDLLKYIREEQAIDELPVIALSAIGNEAVVARFLKAGANDYIMKPFSKEEFFCRINLSLNNLEMLKNIKKVASTDHLTGLYNRHYMQNRLAELSKDKNSVNTLAIIDIDFFKKINDNYGHHTGDLALKFFAIHLLDHFEMNNIIRLGGEEFLVIIPDTNAKKAVLLMEKLRVCIEKAVLTDENNNQISFTISAGVSDALRGDCDKALHLADQKLYKAKASGRNRIEF